MASNEANKDEIAKCIKVAEDSLRNGDEAKADRFLQKAVRMGSAPIDLTDLKRKMGIAPDSPRQAQASPRRTATTTTGTTPSSASKTGATRTGKCGKTYTPEQQALVQRILRTKDYYAMFDVPKDVPEEALKKAYKKFALKLHPDKNAAPGAEEAFKKLSKAFQCLSDAQNRAAYDTYGDEENIPQQQRHGHHQEFMTPEDLFNNLFFGGGGMARHHHRHGQRFEEGGEQRNPLHFLPILLLILVTVFSNFGSRGTNQPQFSFHPSREFRFSKESTRVKVSYYVTTDFSNNYPTGSKALSEFEKHVELYYVQSVNSECDFQEQAMMRKVQLAKRSGGDARAAREAARPACKELERIQKKFPNVYRQALIGTGYNW